jgi:deoxyribodipyrimidine photo-lyase
MYRLLTCRRSTCGQSAWYGPFCFLDYEQASKVGNWQWAAGSGVDAAPYFRIFNPTEQIKKFDKDLKYIKKWIPELETIHYPKPIVDHKEAREKCLKVYKEAVG